jgi:hypothetical protein
MENATILIRRRAGGWVDRGRQYTVLVDGRKVGKLKPGAEATFDVPPGQREIFLKLDWGKSKSVKVNLSPGQRIVLGCEASSLARLPLAMTVGFKSYIKLDIEQEP